MRYAAPVAMPAALGEWLGAELEARGVEAASLYARAVLSILLHSEVAEAELEMDHDPQASWNPRTALELELRLERHVKETKRGRPSKKSFGAKSSNSHHHSKRSNNVSINNGKNQGHSGHVRRRPHSWNGDEETLKKCAAIECLLSATDDGQWGPVEKLVDELCARLKLLQMEQDTGSGYGERRSSRWTASAPECFEAGSSSDTDSFTSVSSPDGSDLAENYCQAFPPLEYLSDSDQGVQQPSEAVWNVRKSAEKPQARVRFVRMPGTRLSPTLLSQSHHQAAVSIPASSEERNFGESCASEAYFGDCSRDSSLERDPTPPTTCIKGRLYERVADAEAASLLNDVLGNAFKSFCQFHEGGESTESAVVFTGDEITTSVWSETQWSQPRGDAANIWAPLESDWALMGPGTNSSWPSEFPAQESTDPAVQLSLALLNHHPERSSFSPVLAKSLQKALPKNSKLFEWLASFTSNMGGFSDDEAKDKDPSCEVESILKEPGVGEDDEEPENLLTSPKTHFCPIQQEGDAEIQVSDGATFDVDAQPEEVHFLRSPSGALYLPECKESGDGWKGWAKYMVYRSPPSPSPTTLALEAAETDEPRPTSRPTTPFTLKFRVVQTEKCCQTDSRIHGDAIDHDKPSTSPLAISSPFTSTFNTSPGLLGAGDVWKFDAQSVSKEWIEELKQPEENASLAEEREDQDGKEEELDGLLSEVWNAAAALNDIPEVEEEVVELKPDVEPFEPSANARAPANDGEGAVEDPGEAVEQHDAQEEEFDLDELWNPFMDEAGDDQVDVCEWVPQAYVPEEGCEPWLEEEMMVESWPPPNIPVEYLDDEFFEEIYGSLDSMKASEAAAGSSAGKNGRRRRRRTSQKQQPPRRPKRPCSFFVEGECRRHDCKFSHDLGSIPCRFWMESACFKGDECPFLHGIPPSKENERNRSCSADELSESYGSEEAEPHHRAGRKEDKKSRKKFQFDLEADFPSLSQAVDLKQRPVISQSRPIAITQGFAAADHTSAGSSLENGAEVACAGALKRRRKRFPCQRVSTVNNVVGTSSESSPVETVAIHLAPVGKRSRKANKVTLCTVPSNALGGKRDKANRKQAAVSADPGAGVVSSDRRRRTKSEHDSSAVGTSGGPACGSLAAGSRLRLSSSYKEG